MRVASTGNGILNRRISWARDVIQSAPKLSQIEFGEVFFSWWGPCTTCLIADRLTKRKFYVELKADISSSLAGAGRQKREAS